MVPAWLHGLSIGSLLLGGVCAAVVAADEIRRPQRMWIMNVVWPLTALFGSLLVLCQYRMCGRGATAQQVAAGQRGEELSGRDRNPFHATVANGTLHCGAGCTLGDICAEWLAVWVPAVPVSFGWHSLFVTKMFAVWILDYIFAYAFGIVFQYFTIAPMRGLSVGAGLVAAVKADTLSLTAWQVGMYTFMAIAYVAVFRAALRTDLNAAMPEFWFMMQIAMRCGFVTSYPVNWWLIRTGIKERMKVQ